jgi:hypothetical protein
MSRWLVAGWDRRWRFILLAVSLIVGGPVVAYQQLQTDIAGLLQDTMKVTACDQGNAAACRASCYFAVELHL